MLDALGAAVITALAIPELPAAAHEPKEWVSAPPPPRNRLVSLDAGLDVGVGVYGDCTRVTDLTHDEAAIDACIPSRTYFIGHNPGPFTPTLNLKPGDEVLYFDSTGTVHPLRIVSDRTWNRFWGVPPLSQGGVTTELQTCVTLDAVWDRILDAVPE